jgi:hypothetical protein
MPAMVLVVEGAGNEPDDRPSKKILTKVISAPTPFLIPVLAAQD